MDTVIRALEQRDIPHAIEDDHSTALFKVIGADQSYSCVIDVDESTQIITLWLGVPDFIPYEKRRIACELLTRANFGLRIGNFEMDLDDGEVRFKIGIDIEGGKIGMIMIQSMIDTARNTFDKYNPAITRVVTGGASAEDALREVET